MPQHATEGLIEQAYRFALKPNQQQAHEFDSWLGASRFWFNVALAEVKDRLDRRAAGEQVDLPWSYKALCSVLKKDWRAEQAPWGKEVPCGAYMSGFEMLGDALQNFSKGRLTGRHVGFPDFKRKGACSESVLFQHPRLVGEHHVEFLDRQGSVRIKGRLTRLCRLLAEDERAKIRRATITRSGRNYYVSFTVVRSPKQRRAKNPKLAVGVDVGLARQATLSNGQTFTNIRPLQENLKCLRRLQRKLDRQRRANNQGNYLPDGRIKPGPKEWVKSRRQLETERLIRRLHERIADQRRHAAHHLTTHLTRNYGVIGAETLNVKGMLANKRLARHISDVGWGLILSQLKYKTEWSEGSLLVLADKYYPSSKTCSCCGSVKAKLDLSERVFACDDCGHTADRDQNAGHNLALNAAREAKTQGMRGIKIAVPADPTRTVLQAATRAARGATDLEKRRLRRGSQATAMNRRGSSEPAPENRRTRVARHTAM